MATLTQIRTALKANVASVTTLNVYRFMPLTPQFPCAVLDWPDELDLTPMILDTGYNVTIPVRIGVNLSDEESADDLLGGFITSVPAAILADKTLGGMCDDLNVEPVSFSRTLTADGATLIQWVDIPVMVLA
jgi:hypothetical protein